MNIKNTLLRFGMAAGLLMSGTAANAAFDSVVNFNAASGAYVNIVNDGQTPATITIDFLPDSLTTFNARANGQGTGFFSGISDNDEALFDDFDIQGGNSAATQDIWESGNYKFTMSEILGIDAGENKLLGKGTASDGSTSLLGYWTISLTAVPDLLITNGAEITNFNFTTQTVAVPLPAAAWLFGSALIGLSGIARRRAAV